MTRILPFAFLAGFLALAVYSRQEEPSYTTQQIAALDDLVARETADDWLSELARGRK